MINVMTIADFNNQLQELQRASEEREAQRRALHVGVPYIDLTKAPFELEALRLVSKEDAIRAQLIPLQKTGRILSIAAYDPTLPQTKAALSGLEEQHFQLRVSVASLSGLRSLFASYEHLPRVAQKITGEIRITEEQLSLAAQCRDLSALGHLLEQLDFKTVQTPEVIAMIFAGALHNHASDIHIEPDQSAVRIRYRMDGLLHDVTTHFARQFYESFVSRIKLLSKLKLNITSEAQDGRFTIFLPESKESEIRVSILPSEYGETIVLRVLYAEAIALTLSDLGLRSDDLEIIQAELQKPDGMILNTGPTGSGKTTTLYAFLRMKLRPEIKIITIEKPIEYHLSGIEQTQVDERAGLDFAGALKSILRQDPDVILVGEINDKNTAEVAVQAALTGHLVFSTVHANSAPAAIPRLIDVGVHASSIGPALNLVIAQRLVRKLCSKCRVAQPLSKDLEVRIAKFFTSLPQRAVRPTLNEVTLYRSQGCAICSGFGYKGRIGVFELFLVDDVVEALIQKGDSSLGSLNAIASTQGMVTVQQDGVLKILKGMTTFEELEDVTGPLNF